MATLTAKQLERKRTKDAAVTAQQATTSATPDTIDIRARQSEVERQAETAKAEVREIEREERRARDLPFKPGRTKGLADAVADIDKARQEALAKGKAVGKAIDKVVAEHKARIKAIAKYKSDDGYDLVAMVRDGYTTKQLTELGFNTDVVAKAQGRAGELEKADKYKGDTGYDVLAMIKDGYTEAELTSLFGKDAAQAGITRADIVDRAAKYQTDAGYDVAAMTRDNFPKSDMAVLFDTDTITFAAEVVKADKYKTETGYDLLAMYDAGYSQDKLKGMGFDAEAVAEAHKYHTAVMAMEPYRTTDGAYDMGKIADAINEGGLTEDTVTTVLGENPVPYLTVEQVLKIRFSPTAEAYKLGAEWGVTSEQVDHIKAARTEDYARVYAYLQDTAEGITRSTIITLPEFETQPRWKITAAALKDIEPYQTEGGYDAGRAYAAMIEGKLARDSFVVAFGPRVYNDMKAFYAAHVEVTPGQWVAKADWKGLTDAQQQEVIATGKYTKVDTAGLVALNTGEYIAEEDWGKLDATAQAYLKEHGVDKFNEEYTYTTPEPSQGWLKDTWNNIKESMVPTDKAIENATTYCQSWGIKDQKVVDAAAQLIQLSRMILPRPEADPRTDPKGYLIESGKALAAFAPVLWAVNWKDMTPRQRIINVAVDVVIIASLGLGKGLAAARAKPAMNAAKAAGKAADAMDDSLRVLAKTPVDDLAKYGQASSNAQKAIQASKVADGKFITALEQVKALAPGQLAKLEKVSRIKGLRNAITDVANAQAQLQKAWKAVPKSTLQTMGGKKYVAAMTKVERAQAALNKALDTFNTKLEPRFKVNQTPEFKGFATQWHKKTRIALEGGDPVITPLGGKGKGVQLAVLEKTKPVVTTKTFYELKLKPVYKTAAEAARKVAPPAVKAVTKATTAGIAAATITRGMTQVDRQTALAVGKVMKAVTGKTQPVTAMERNAHAAIQTITHSAVRTGLNASARNVTHGQLQDLVQADVKQGVRSITDPALKSQIQTHTKTLTKLAVKVVTRVAPKQRISPKTIKPKPRLKVPDVAVKHDKQGRPIYPKGTVVFKMGKLKRGNVYKAMLPPYTQTDLVTSKLPPVGMKRTEGTPEQTLTVIGDKKLPFGDLSADIGIVDVFVDTRRKKIKFTPGRHTNVGKRIQSTTRGVSLGDAGMKTTRQGQVFVTKARGSKHVALSRFNPRKRPK